MHYDYLKCIIYIVRCIKKIKNIFYNNYHKLKMKLETIV